MIDPLSPPSEVINNLALLKASCPVLRVNKLCLDQEDRKPGTKDELRAWKDKYSRVVPKKLSGAAGRAKRRG